MKKLILFATAVLFVTNSGKAQSSIRGYIVSLEAAKPIENATIFLNDKYGLPLEDSLRVTSDSTGFYKIAGIKTALYSLSLLTINFVSCSYQGRIKSMQKPSSLDGE